MYKIGELAKIVNVSIDTIRYYEKIGLIPQPERLNKYRSYDKSYIQQIGFIKKSKKLGFSLDEIDKLITVSKLPVSECDTIYNFMIDKAKEIEIRIKELNILKDAVIEISSQCNTGYDINECPIIRKLIRYS